MTGTTLSGTGSDNAGDIYAYGAAASTDRALGTLRSGTLIPTIGACFTNNTGASIVSLAIAYTGEEWRLGTASRTDQLNFEYSTNATSLTTGTWTGVAALNFMTPDTVATGGRQERQRRRRPDSSQFLNYAQYRQWGDRLDPLDRF